MNIENIVRELESAHQKNMLVSLPAFLVRILSGILARIKPLFFAGQAGTGKTHAAKKIASVLGASFVKIPSTISLTDLHSMLAEHCSTGKRAKLIVWLIDEFHAVNPRVRELLLRLTDSGGESVKGEGLIKVDGEERLTEWEYCQEINLMIYASNHGEGDPALVGPNGRAQVIEILPLTDSARKMLAWKWAAKFGRQYGVSVSPSAMDTMLVFCCHVARNVENRLAEFIETAATRGLARIERKDVPSLADSLEYGLDGLAPSDMRILADLAQVGPSGDLLRRIMDRTLPNRDKEFKLCLHRLTERKLVSVTSKGHRQCITEAGLELVKKGDQLV